MRSIVFSIPFATLASALLLAYSPPAAAQADLNPPPPNVLLLIDTSGSMEYLTDGTAPLLDASNKCQAPAPGQSNMNRWATLVSVLTGSIENYSCYAQPRTKGTPFEVEYSLSGVPPYDLGYHLPFHRILSNDCTIGPDKLPATWSGWPADALKQHPWNNAAGTCAAPGFKQSADGLLDTFADRARFGIMTFDSFINEETGVNGNAMDPIPGAKGMWSYYLGWDSGGGAPAAGNPPDCSQSTYEVGARNPAAPPWEGRLIGFGAQDADAATMLANNTHVQDALLAMRPYGATPLAGMLQDAREFIYDDDAVDPATSAPIGPKKDDYFAGGCRQTFVVVLSDGEPNLDLRKEGCATGNGKCPYQQPWEIASAMATGAVSSTRVRTFAVGLGLSSAAGFDCNLIGPADVAAGGQCDKATGALAGCCTLARIAIEGGSKKAYFADDISNLRTALSKVFGEITAGAKTRTLPTFSVATAVKSAQGNAEAVGYRFGAQFDTPSESPLWIGKLVRERYRCVAQNGGPQKSETLPVDDSKGDNFARNLNSNDAAHQRRFMTVMGENALGKVHSARSIRPKLAAANKDDGMGLYSGTATGAGTPLSGPSFASQARATPEAFGINPASPPMQCTGALNTSDPTTCTDRLVRWEVGEVDSGLPTRDVTGCQVSDGNGNLMGCELGSIYHSSPAVIGPPNEFIRDESYDQFAIAQVGRPTMLYVGSTDGQLHAFKVAANDSTDSQKVDKLENNELWSFLPPAVLPRLLTTYNQQAILFDSSPVVQDIVMERTTTQSIAGYGASGPQWRTVLLAGGGRGGGYYFALDVTDPEAPEFLWQISQDFEGGELFGPSVPVPAMATISLSENGGAAKSVAVAILPGGSDALLPGTCPRVIPPPYSTIDGSTPRGSTRCWVQGAGRSLSIVRLDTGEVIRTFLSPKAAVSLNLAPTRKTAAPFDSPLTGTPVPYPAKAGQITNRIYIGDADGTLWRVNLAKPNPNDWTVEMMWDAYSGQGDDQGQPIETPPVVSVDNLGQPVLMFSTGDQDQLSSATSFNRVWSILETINGSSFKAKENYHLDMIDGERVTGPISLFSGTAYFSSFKPKGSAKSGNACDYGEGKLWGVDYKEKPAGSGLPYGRLDPLDDTILSQSFGVNSIVFGVAVTQTPSCSDTTTYNDPVFGQYTSVSGGSPGDFQLAYQVSSTNPPQQGNGASVITTKTLPSPRMTTRIDSWAAVVE